MTFQKGHIPWNKDRKGLQVAWNKELKGFKTSGSFKKGHQINKGNQYAKGNPPNRTSFKKRRTPWNKKGKYKSGGRWFILKSDGSYIRQSRLVAKKCLGRRLTSEEVIHHIGAKDDDRPEMLYLFSSNSAHISYEKLKNKPILKSNLIDNL